MHGKLRRSGEMRYNLKQGILDFFPFEARWIPSFFFFTICTGFFIVMTMTFVTAYNNPSKTVLLRIDHFGEANFELCIILLTTILGIYTLAMLVKHYTRLF
jgi:hypothetical protein